MDRIYIGRGKGFLFSLLSLKVSYTCADITPFVLWFILWWLFFFFRINYLWKWKSKRGILSLDINLLLLLFDTVKLRNLQYRFENL